MPQLSVSVLSSHSWRVWEAASQRTATAKIVYRVDLRRRAGRADVRPTDTKRVHAALRAMGCTPVAAARWHVKWITPGGHVATTVAGQRRQSPGVLRHVQHALEGEFGPGWLQKALHR